MFRTRKFWLRFVGGLIVLGALVAGIGGAFRAGFVKGMSSNPEMMASMMAMHGGGMHNGMQGGAMDGDCMMSATPNADGTNTQQNCTMMGGGMYGRHGGMMGGYGRGGFGGHRGGFFPLLCLLPLLFLFPLFIFKSMMWRRFGRHHNGHGCHHGNHQPADAPAPNASASSDTSSDSQA
ncbi:MAG TPA: hypothetical protein PK299_13705 [Anaerolineales bacterium]|nr:hypothetical protein [Anaerolineales bacterium]